MQDLLDSQNSSERIKQLVEKEGKAARNLVTWSVPVTDSENSEMHDGNIKVMQQTANHSNSRYNNAERNRKRGKNQSHNSTHTFTPLAEQTMKQNSGGSQTSLSECEKICKYYSSKAQRHLRSSKSPSKLDLHARYWSYLFDNLHRAVDEIYKTCDVDESVIECQEVIMTLEVCRKDFEALIKKIQLFEQSDLHTKSSNLAWEVRKTTSPGKPRALTSPQATPSPPPPSPIQSLPHIRSSHRASQHGASIVKSTPKRQSSLRKKISDQQTQDSKQNIPESMSMSSSSRSDSRPSSARNLEFGNLGHSKARNHNSPTEASNCENNRVGDGLPTWADKVKGVTRPISSTGIITRSHPLKSKEKVSEDSTPRKELTSEERLAEEEGWEMVTRGRAKSAGGTCKPNQHGHPSQSEEESVASPKSSQSDCVIQQSSKDPVTDKIGGGEIQPKKNEQESNKKRRKEMSLKEVLSAIKYDSKYEKDDISSCLGFPLEEIKSWSKGTPDEDVVIEMVQEWMNGPGNGHKEEGEEEEEGINDEGKKEKCDINRRGESVQTTEKEGGGVANIKVELLSEDSLPNMGEEGKVSKEEVKDDENEIRTWDDALAVYDANEGYRAEMSWADRCDSPPGGFSDIPRSPGRAIHLHQRLSSPSRKRQVEQEETRRIQEEKQAKAQLQRSKLQEEKTQKSRVEADKIREARESRDALTRQRKEALEDKLQRAEILRESHLQERIRRAQEEEAKVSEISFINTLEAQNRKIEVLERYQGREARLQELLDERQKRRDEQLAKEEAAQERRKTIEAERQAKLMEMEQKRKEQEAKVEQLLLERERIREEAAREKSKERERKLMAHNTALQISTEELGRKIQLKQNESSRRYDQQIEQKKKLVISSRHTSADQPPRVEAYKTKKWCTACNVEIISEVYLLSHLRGRKHLASLALLSSADGPTTDSEGGGEGEEDPMIIDAPEDHQGPPGELPEVQERMHAGKKRAKKLRQRMSTRAKEIENRSGSVHSHSKNRAKLQKALRELNKQVDSASSSASALGGLHLNLTSFQIPLVDRVLGDIIRSLVSHEDKLCFCQLGGVASVLKMLMLSTSDPDGKCSLPEKSFSLGVNVLLGSCAGQLENCQYLVVTNKAVPLIDLSLIFLVKALSDRQLYQGSPQNLKTSKEGTKQPSDTSLCGLLLHLIASMVSTLASGSLAEEDTPVIQQVKDSISYMVSVRLVDKLGEYFGTIYGPIEQLSITQLVLGGLNLLVATTAFLHLRVVDVFSGKSCDDDPTLLTTLLQQTELVGLMQLLYAILLSDGPPRHSHSPPLLTNHTLSIAMATIKALNNSAILDLRMVQACLGAEGISLEFRHIMSYLLWYCSHHNESTNLLHELILAVGYFCVLNHDNQVYLQSGRRPTLLQLLCGLPFEYFSNLKLSQLLYPTLISACYQMEDNRVILEEEISSKLLVVFIKEATLRDDEEKERTKKEKSRKDGNSNLDLSSMLCHRFPRMHWEKATEYFSQSLSEIKPIHH